MQIHLLCIISIHSWIIPVISVIMQFPDFPDSIFPFWTFSSSLASLCPIQALFSCFPLFAFFSFGHFPLLLFLYVQFRLWFPAFLSLLSSLLDIFRFSCFFMSNSGYGFLLSSLCFLLFWTFSASLASLCPIQAMVSCFPRLAFFSFGLFSFFLLHYVQFNL